jgi:hypothetical protein
MSDQRHKPFDPAPENRSTVRHGRAPGYESAEAQAHRGELRGGKHVTHDTPPGKYAHVGSANFHVRHGPRGGPIQISPAGFAADGSGKYRTPHGRTDGTVRGTHHVRTALPPGSAPRSLDNGSHKGGRGRGK